MRTLNNLQGAIDGTVRFSSCDLTIIIAGLALYQAEVHRSTGEFSKAASTLLGQLSAVQAGLRTPENWLPKR
jgi:hypothetical protein